MPNIVYGFLFVVFMYSKEDVRVYLEQRAVFPELYSAPKGWYGGHYQSAVQKELPDAMLEEMRTYYRKLLSKYKDVMRVPEISKLTGYGTTTINNWCAGGKLRHFTSGRSNLVPKVFLMNPLIPARLRSLRRFWQAQSELSLACFESPGGS